MKVQVSPIFPRQQLGCVIPMTAEEGVSCPYFQKDRKPSGGNYHTQEKQKVLGAMWQVERSPPPSLLHPHCAFMKHGD